MRRSKWKGWDWQSVSTIRQWAAPFVMERWKAALESGEPFEEPKVEDFIIPLRVTADAAVPQFLTRIQPFKDSQGRLVQWFGTNTDIETLKQAEMAAVRLAAIVESSTDAVIGKDLNGIVTSWNDAAERMFGYSRGEVVGRSITLIIPANHHEDEERFLSKIKRGERIEHFETERLRKDGSTIAISLTVSPIKDSHGHVVGASKVARDITERKHVERALQESEERFRLLVEGVHEYALILLDREGRVVSWNAGAERVKGYKTEEIIGRSFSVFYPPEDVAAGKPAMALKLVAEQERWGGRRVCPSGPTERSSGRPC